MTTHTKLYTLDHDKIIEWNIEKDGAKYYYLDRKKVDKSTLREHKNYGAPLQFYDKKTTLEEIIEKKNILSLLQKIVLCTENVSIEKLRALKNVLEN